MTCVRVLLIHRLRATRLNGVEVKAGQHDHREQHDVTERRSEARSEELKCEAENVNRDGLGRRATTAFGQDVDDIENLEGLDRAEQQRQQQQAPDVGKRDGPKSSPPSGPVYLGGFL